MLQPTPVRKAHYRNFTVAVYVPAHTVNRMADMGWLESRWSEISRQLMVDKIYLETYRATESVEDGLMRRVKKFFDERGVETAGGITYTVLSKEHFNNHCYSSPDQRRVVREQAERTAWIFDEIILDDFYFTNCKCEACVKAKGKRSWTSFRMKLLADAARDCIVGPAHAVNPKVRVVIKYPNWYDHFQGLGFDLDTGPGIFDGIYTGTETRDPVITHQHLQPYEGYSILRYFENISPARNGGGWVDTFGVRDLDRYVEQLWLTMFAKPREITLFMFNLMLNPLSDVAPAPWQDGSTSFDHRAMLAEMVSRSDAPPAPPATMARAAGYALEQVDGFLDRLGKPVGISSYQLRASSGEDFLQNYLGMLGIPIEMVPRFPEDERIIILTESCAADPALLDRIERRLRGRRDVLITSGLLRALQGRGIERIAEIACTDKKLLATAFLTDWCRTFCPGTSPVFLPQIHYLTNDSWSIADALAGDNGSPVLHSADYVDGHLYVLAVPDNFADLYLFPEPVLRNIRQVLMRDWEIRLDAPAKVALFCYDNGAFIVESFRDDPVDIQIVTKPGIGQLRDLLTDETLSAGPLIEAHPWHPIPDAGKHAFSTSLRPHSFRVFGS